MTTNFPVYALGVDPDSKASGIALLELASPDAQPSIVTVDCVKTKGYVEQMTELARRIDSMIFAFDIIVVEGQDITRGRTHNPASILQISAVSGAAIASATFRHRDRKLVAYPTPAAWTGGFDKATNQSRAFRKLDIEFSLTDGKKPYCVPKLSQFKIRQGDWKHVSDSIALALWGIGQWQKAEKIRKWTENPISLTDKNLNS